MQVTDSVQQVNPLTLPLKEEEANESNLQSILKVALEELNAPKTHDDNLQDSHIVTDNTDRWTPLQKARIKWIAYCAISILLLGAMIAGGALLMKHGMDTVLRNRMYFAGGVLMAIPAGIVLIGAGAGFCCKISSLFQQRDLTLRASREAVAKEILQHRTFYMLNPPSQELRCIDNKGNEVELDEVGIAACWYGFAPITPINDVTHVLYDQKDVSYIPKSEKMNDRAILKYLISIEDNETTRDKYQKILRLLEVFDTAQQKVWAFNPNNHTDLINFFQQQYNAVIDS